jgi:hypothetical protein
MEESRMTEEERVKSINERAGVHLQDLLEQLENEEITPDDLLPPMYAAMIVSILYGYSPNAMVEDAQAAASRLLTMLDEEESKTHICANIDEDGNCPLHNLHCQYPDCEKRKVDKSSRIVYTDSIR